MWHKYTRSKRRMVYVDVADILRRKPIEKKIGEYRSQIERAILFGL